MVHFKIPNLSPALPHLGPSIYEDSDLFLGLQDNPGHRGVLETPRVHDPTHALVGRDTGQHESPILRS